MSHTSEDPRAGDALLLSRVLRREERAWRELLSYYRPLMLRCILRTVHRHAGACSGDEANEIFGEACLDLLRDDMRKLRQYRPERGARLGSWLGLLSAHAACDHLRKRSRRPCPAPVYPVRTEPDEQDPVAELCAQGPSALDQLLEKERMSILRDSLPLLSDRDRHFVELFYGEGLPADQVAAHMGISLKTVYSKRNKLCARLAKRAAPLAA